MLGDGEPGSGVIILLILALLYVLTNSSTSNTSNETVVMEWRDNQCQTR